MPSKIKKFLISTRDAHAVRINILKFLQAVITDISLNALRILNVYRTDDPGKSSLPITHLRIISIRSKIRLKSTYKR